MNLSNTLNVIDENWQAVLGNNQKFQGFKAKKDKMFGRMLSTQYYDYQPIKEQHQLSVLVVAYCQFNKRFANKLMSLIVCNSEPLVEIAKAMYSDMDSDAVTSDFKFNFPVCSILTCNDCKTQFARFKSKGFLMNGNIQQP